MDDLVRSAMARWPDVPAAWGWLRLDRRGGWRLVDRNAPGFDESVHGAGDPVRHDALIDFIGRNYAADEQGRWFFQNGPQRVFVDLELAPRIWRVAPQADGVALVAHTGELAAHVERLAVDAAGTVWAVTELGPGAIDDRQLAALLGERDTADGDGPAPSVRLHGRADPVPIEPLAQPPEQAFGFVRRPRAG